MRRLLAAAAVILAGCGASKAAPSAHASSQDQLSQCMRSHGVPNFPDPTHGSGGEGFSVMSRPGSFTVDGIAFSGPAFEAAVKTCKLFGGGSGPPAISEHQKLTELRFAQCMRAHGIKNFSDPIFPPGGGIERPDTPGLNRNSPAFQSAVKACNNP